MKIVRPLTLGLLHKPYRFRGEHRLVIAALGFFRLGADDDRFLTDNLQWPKIIPLLPPLTPLDEVMPKPRGEALLSGSAFAPGGKAVKSMKVRLQVGEVDKTVKVTGDREWFYGLLPWYRVSDPIPFTSLPLVYARAWGGPQHKGNPVGVGYTGNPFSGVMGRNQGPMPNLEYPKQAARRHWRRYRPAGFGPVDITWMPRSQYHGTYDKRWLAEDAPGLARDTDFAAFNRAPEDQQLTAYFQGGEKYSLEGVHPELPRIEGRLPTHRARAFVLRQGMTPEQAEEVPMVMDTVWFFPEVQLGIAVYRGQCALADSDALDIQAVMAAYDHAEGRRDADHYRAVMKLRLDPETALLHAFNESQLAPPRSPQDIARRVAAKSASKLADLARRQAMLDEAAADFWAQSGMTPPADYVPPQADVLPMDHLSQEEIESGDFDLSELVAQATAIGEDAKRQGEEKIAQLDQRRAELPPAPPATGDDIAAQRNAAFERACLMAVDLLPQEQQGSAASAQAAQLSQALDDAAAAGHVFAPGQKEELVRSLQQLPSLRRQGRRAAQTATMPEQPLAAENALWLGQQILQWHQAGVPLAGRDLAGINLRGADFSGADLREILLENADLTGASFVGADLSGAVLTGAILDQADFSAANLEGANLNTCQGRGAHFVRASLNKAFANDSRFPGADFSHARMDDLLGQNIVLEDATLDGCVLHRTFLAHAQAADSTWRGAQLEAVVALGANLADADFSKASLLKAVLMDADLSRSLWREARLESIYAGGKSLWNDAQLTGAKAKSCGWHGASLVAADFSRGEFLACEFGKCDMRRARLEGGLFARSLFLQAQLGECRAQGADFYQALCRKTDFTGGDLRDTNFVQAELGEVIVADALLDGAQFDPASPLRRAA